MANIRVLSRGPKHHFYGYYGINPWDHSGRRHLALETDFHEHAPRPDDQAGVGLVDADTGAFQPYASTAAFNLQQGSMMHWIDAGHGEEFTFNDWEDGRLVSRAVDPATGSTRTINGAIAAVSPTAPVAIGLDFARMSFCRQVVGYANDGDRQAMAPYPEDDGLFRLDLRTGEARLLVSIASVIQANPAAETQAGRAWFNHVLFNTDGSRLLFFCRIRKPGGGHYSSLWTVNADGTGLACQIPYGNKISHFAWLDPQRVLISTDVLGDLQFVLFTDGAGDYAPFGQGQLPVDGHAGFSPDFRRLVCDTYPLGPDRLSELMLYDLGMGVKTTLGRFHSPPQFTGTVRCDLHPRWRPDGGAVTFDSVHEGTRQIYLAEITPG